MSLVRRHLVVCVLLVFGVVLRVLVTVAYRPANFYPDSAGYLLNARFLRPFPQRPFGYPAYLRLVLDAFPLGAVPIIQHLLVLAAAIALYALALRAGIRPWLAAIAVAPLLLDAYLLAMEQYILSDVLFIVLVVAALCVLVWPRSGLNPGWCFLAGLLLGYACLVRTSGAPLLAVIGLYAVARSGTWRQRTARLLAVALAGIGPLAVYAVWSKERIGTFSISQYSGAFLYGRVAPFADCSGLDLPPRERAMCPTVPVAERPSGDAYTWSPSFGAAHFVREYGPIKANHLLKDFSVRIIKYQPGTYLDAALSDIWHGYAPTHSTRPGDVTERYSTFTLASPGSNPKFFTRRYGGGKPVIVKALGRFLRGYQRFGYLPGTAIAILIVVCLAAMLDPRSYVRRWRAPQGDPATLRRLRVDCALLCLAAIVLVWPGSFATGFTWRYIVPEVVLIPSAAALALTYFVPGLRLRAPDAQRDA